jgi:peptide/nickel transport system permease protein
MSGSLTAKTGRHLSHGLENPVLRLLARRILFAVPQLVIVSGLSFTLISLTPGNAAQTILGLNATPTAEAALRQQLGLNLPLWHQYWNWLSKAVTGNFGVSPFTGQPVSQVIGQRLPVTLSLVVGALLVSLIVGVAVGMVSALRGGLIGRALDVLALIGFALPAFWVGAELIVLFAVRLHWFPAVGYTGFSTSPSGWVKSLVLPVTALALGGVAGIAKQTREAMLEVLGTEYIRMTWASGISARAIIFRHVLKNSAIRILTVLGVQAVSLLAGTIFVESVFGLPGLGSTVATAALQHDLPTVQGIAVVFTIIVVAVNILIDLAYAWINPRVRVS